LSSPLATNWLQVGRVGIAGHPRLPQSWLLHRALISFRSRRPPPAHYHTRFKDGPRLSTRWPGVGARESRAPYARPKRGAFGAVPTKSACGRSRPRMLATQVPPWYNQPHFPRPGAEHQQEGRQQTLPPGPGGDRRLHRSADSGNPSLIQLA
jgi:hypothetical protein